MGRERNDDELVMKHPLMRRDDAIAWSILSSAKTDSTRVPFEGLEAFLTSSRSWMAVFWKGDLRESERRGLCGRVWACAS